MPAMVGKEYQVTAKEMNISTHDQTFLTIAGTHVNGAYAAFPGFGLSAELSSLDDLLYNTNALFEMLQSSDDPWLPKRDDELYEIAKDLSEIITPLVSSVARETAQETAEEKRMNQGYEIIETCTIGSTEMVIGHNPGAAKPYACWWCESSKEYLFGSYFDTLTAARKELNERHQMFCYTEMPSEDKAIEKMRSDAGAAGLPFSKKPWGSEVIDPFVFDGSMSVEDYDRMQLLREARRADGEESPAEAPPEAQTPPRRHVSI